MGLILIAAMFAGGALGLMISGTGLAVGLIATKRAAASRKGVWKMFWMAFGVLLVLLIVGVQLYPYDPVKPGSDYDVTMKNLFLQALGYCGSPGIAGLVAALTTKWCPQKG
jgi:hypothetical protein